MIDMHCPDKELPVLLAVRRPQPGSVNLHSISKRPLYTAGLACEQYLI